MKQISKNRNIALNKTLSMNIEKYKKETFDIKTINSLLKSEKDIEEDRTRDATEVIEEFREKYGF